MYDMNGKIAIVTGAARGIGKEIARALAESGALPVVVDIDEQGARLTAEELGKACGRTLGWRAADLSDVTAVKAMVESVYKEYGVIDVLVNNAGILDNYNIEDLEEETWDRVIDCNLKSVFFCSKYVYAYMKERGSGHIVNVASVAGRMGGHSAGCAYAASKGGILSMTMNFARKAAPLGICVNAVAPGTIESDMSMDFTQEQKERLYANIPMRRFGRPAEIAEAVLFLASDASAFMCGAVVDVNGGMFMG